MATRCEHCQAVHGEDINFCPVTGKRILSSLFPEGSMFEGKYRMGPVIGVGGMGVVFDATHVLLDKRMAIKVMLPGADTDENMMARMVREARAASATGHRNIAQVTDMGWASEDSLYVVMEFVDGPTLLEVVNAADELEIPRAVGLTQQILSGLETVHKKGIVHRDLKPENLMLVTEEDGEEVIKILDFGISKVLSGAEDLSLTAAGMVVGSPLYMSPEQASGMADVDHQTDIYSTGAVLYLLLTRHTPVEGDNLNAVLAATIAGEITPPSHHNRKVPRELDEVVLTALAQDRRYRYSTAGDFRDALEPFLHEGRTTGPRYKPQMQVPISTQAGVGLARMPKDLDADAIVTLDQVVRTPTQQARAAGKAPRSTSPLDDDWPGAPARADLEDDPRFRPPDADDLVLEHDPAMDEKAPRGLVTSAKAYRDALAEKERKAAEEAARAQSREATTGEEDEAQLHPAVPALVSRMHAQKLPVSAGEATGKMTAAGKRKPRGAVPYGQARKRSTARQIVVAVLVLGIVLVVGREGLRYYEQQQEELRRKEAATVIKQEQIQKVKIVFNVKPGDATIQVDGVRLITQPLWLIRSESEYKVEISAAGYRTKVLYIKPAQDLNVQVELKRGANISRDEPEDGAEAPKPKRKRRKPKKAP